MNVGTTHKYSTHGNSPTGTGKRPRPGSLKTLDKIRLEMSRVYRDARTGTLRAEIASRLVYILATMAALVEKLPRGEQADSFDKLLRIVQKDRAKLPQMPDEPDENEDSEAQDCLNINFGRP